MKTLLTHLVYISLTILLLCVVPLYTNGSTAGGGNQNDSSTTKDGKSTETTKDGKPAEKSTDETDMNGTDMDGSACDPKKDIMLNISIPFIGRCIKKTSSVDPAQDTANNSTIGNVFPKLMGGLIRITMTAVYIIGFLGILIGGFMVASNGALKTKDQGIKLIVAVIGGMILLGISGIILNLINPEFFGTDS